MTRYHYRIVTAHAKPLGDGADWLHGKDGVWYRSERPQRFTTLRAAQLVLWALNLDRDREARVIAWPNEPPSNAPDEVPDVP